MSDILSPAVLALNAFRLLACLNIAIAVAFLSVLVVALVCCLFEMRCGRRDRPRPAALFHVAVASLVVWCPQALEAQTRSDNARSDRLSPTISLEQDTARTVTRRVWADADLYRLSPDGRLASFMDWSSEKVAIRDMETGEVRDLTAGEGGFADNAVFSHDGKWLAYDWYDYAEPGYYKLGVVDVEGREARIIYRDRATGWIGPGDWSPDGRYIVISRTVEASDAQELMLIRAEDGDARLLKSFPNPSPGKGPGGISFSPDGRYVAYHRWSEDPENSDVYVLNVSTGEEHVLIGHQDDDRMLGWAPDGRHVLFQSDRSGTPGAWLLPVADGRATGAPWLVKPDMWRTEGVGFTRDGRYFYKVTTSRSDVYVANFDPQSRSIVGTPTAVSARSPFNTSGASWSPDGRHLAYRRERDQTSPVDKVVVQSLETGDVKEFDLGVPGWIFVHSWTADGRALVIVASNPGDRDNRVALYRLDVQTGRKELLSNPVSDVPLTRPLPAPDDGSLLYLLSEENDASQAAFRIIRYDLATGDSTALFRTPFGPWGQIRPGLTSPDGKTLAFGYQPPGGPPRLVLLPIDGGTPTELPVEVTTGITWMPFGRALLFQRLAEVGPPRWEFWYLDLSKETPQPIGLSSDGTRPGLDVDPSGRRIAYTSGRSGSELWVMENFLPAGGRR